MAEESQSWRLQMGEYLGEISALCFLHLPPHFSSFPYLLAGTGSQMLLYDLETGNVIRSFHVLEGIRVHGITSCLANYIEGSPSSMLAFKIAVFGERRVKLFNLNIEMAFLTQNQPKVCMDLILLHLLPKFNQWVLDASFLKGYMTSHQGSGLLAVGCSDNSVCIWDIQRSSVILKARCPERCLLYSMRLWGEELEALRIASGTIYNEIIVWKVVLQDCPTYLKEQADPPSYFINNNQLHDQHYRAVHIDKLAGHEGSIFRIAWSSDGSTLVSVSDDRSACIWTLCFKEGSSNDSMEGNNLKPVDRVLFGHDARVWDCCIFDSLIITAGEDCTCRVWEVDGKQLKMIKEHIGRGIWRCLYDPISSLLITAGFDSAIKVHQLYAPFRSLEQRADGVKEFINRTEIFTARIPNSSSQSTLMDSKSEYIRCLQFAYEEVFYVATNHGYLYLAQLCNTGGVKWTELAQVTKDVPIICMDLLSRNLSKSPSHIDDWIAVGDGQGRMTVVNVGGDVSAPKVSLECSWSAELKRRLLGSYWCKSLGHRYIFTTDPRGMLKLWKLSDPIFSSHNSVENFSASLIAEFESCFGIRIMCLDISFDEELLVCGDLHGNMVLFPLLKSTLLGAPIASEVRITPLNYFRGAHGISTVSSISITGFYPGQIDICSTGGDGCICYMEYHKDEQNLDFIGMKQVKELSLIESTSTDINSVDDLASHNYAIGFASADFIIWNLATETKVVQVSCGGWRRPHSYYLGGEMAEMKNCFAYVKDETIHVHRHWVSNGERKSFPQNLHMQFHGREMHCLRFVARDSQSDADGFQISRSTFISTGCEDGTVRLTRYALGVENWSALKLLGEHVGGSAVRSICFVSKMHTVAANVSNMPNGSNRLVAASEDRGIPFLLISVGAKRVLTSWLLGNRRRDRKETLNSSPNNETGDFVKPSSGDFSSMTFKWLSTDMPTKYSFTQTGKMVGSAKNEYSVKSDASSGSLHPETTEKGLKNSQQNICEIDWRYLAVTAFLVTSGSSRFSVCFVVVACSDATLALRALVLPCRLWFDVALLVPLSSPVLALQHVVVPIHLPTGDSTQIANAFVVISGSTDGSIAFWDLSVSIRTFMQRVSTFLVEKSFNFPKRPRTGRGSQGGRLWRSLGRTDPKINPQPGESTNGKIHNLVVPEGLSKSIEPNNSAAAFSQNSPTSSLESELNKNDFLSEICEIYPFSIQNNIHQSGVNCLHVSEVQNGQSSEFSSRHVVLSGGDDQSLCCIGFDLALLPTCVDPDKKSPDVVAIAESENMNNSPDYIWDHKCIVRFLYHSSIASAHSSAVKGIWTDGKWAFSTGLDQRVRCWQLEDHGKVTERHHLIVSVPEPEALDARACGRDCYQIAVAGRGMQMVEFCTPKYSDGER